MNKELKVMFISHSSGLTGAETSLLIMVSEMVKRGIKATVIVPGPGLLNRRLSLLSVSLVEVTLTRWIDFEKSWALLFKQLIQEILVSKKIAKIAKEQNIDIIHTNSIVNIAGALAAWQSGIPHVWHIREILSNNPHIKFLLPEKLILGIVAFSAARVITISGAVKSKFPQRAQKKIEVVHNAVDTERFDPTKYPVNVCRKKLSIAEDEIVLGIVGTIDKRKGHFELAQAFKELQDRYPQPWKLLIIGPEDSIDAAPLKQMIQKHNIKNIIFTGYKENMPELYAAIDILMAPSWEEPFGRVIIEGMSMEKPVIACDSGGAKDIIDNEKTGILVKPKSSRDLADAIARLLENRDFANQIAKNGRIAVLSRFSIRKNIEHILNIYEKLVRNET